MYLQNQMQNQINICESLNMEKQAVIFPNFLG
jgi:hypothetical protein